MPSIRRSLIAYFLILLLAALGRMRLLVDHIAADMKKSWQVAESNRIEQEYTFRCKETKAPVRRGVGGSCRQARPRTAGEVTFAVSASTPARGVRPDPERDQEYRKFHRLGVGGVAGVTR